jgi:hypothetical protein
MRLLQHLARTTTATVMATLGACASAPTHFYTLQQGAAPTANAAPASSAPFLIDVLPVAVPPQVDQAEFLVRQRVLTVVSHPVFTQAKEGVSESLTPRGATLRKEEVAKREREILGDPV